MLAIRPYRVEDLPAVVARSVRSAWDQLVERERPLAQVPAVSRQLADMYQAVLAAPGSLLLLAEAPGLPAAGPAGHVLLFPQANPFTGVREMVVMDIWVHPLLRRRGVGSALLRDAERHARGAGARGLVAQIALHNHASQALFRRMGYRPERVVVGRGL